MVTVIYRVQSVAFRFHDSKSHKTVFPSLRGAGAVLVRVRFAGAVLVRVKILRCSFASAGAVKFFGTGNNINDL